MSEEPETFDPNDALHGAYGMVRKRVVLALLRVSSEPGFQGLDASIKLEAFMAGGLIGVVLGALARIDIDDPDSVATLRAMFVQNIGGSFDHAVREAVVANRDLGGAPK